MTNFKKQIVSAAAAGAMLFNVAMPAFASTEIVISGNGTGSDNLVQSEQKNETTVNQNNNATVTNNVNADAKTGGNDANFNTGGLVVIDTGNAKSTVNVDNTLNSNSAEVDCCVQGDTDVTIDGNGAWTDNAVDLKQKNKNKVYQNNNANVTNDVDADAKTGGNDAHSNTGGDVVILTGNATADVDVSTTANVNSASIGGSNGHNNPSASFVISGNGTGSDNYINAKLKNYNKVDQDNDADVDNDVNADAKTGKNDANFNTGGDVIIDTGNATTSVDVDNSVNFNHADLDCGCVWDVLAKIADNGAQFRHGQDADNYIGLELKNKQKVYQDNYANLYNDVDEDAKTGNNEAKLNTGDSDADPAIFTGNATSSTTVSNSGNVNSVGDLLPFDWPDFDHDVEFSFNFLQMMAFFGMSL